jgi:hypothetical protein
MIRAALAKSALRAYEIDAAINGGLTSPQGVRPGAGTIDLMVEKKTLK